MLSTKVDSHVSNGKVELEERSVVVAGSSSSSSSPQVKNSQAASKFLQPRKKVMGCPGWITPSRGQHRVKGAEGEREKEREVTGITEPRRISEASPRWDKCKLEASPWYRSEEDVIWRASRSNLFLWATKDVCLKSETAPTDGQSSQGSLFIAHYIQPSTFQPQTTRARGKVT